MIKRIIDSKLPVIVYNPSGVMDTNYFKECYSAGSLPVFDTEFFSNEDIKKWLGDLSSEKIIFGVRVDVNNKEVIDYLNNNFISNLDLIVLNYDHVDDLEKCNLTTTEYKVFIEAIDVKIDDKLEAFEPSGIIVKGNEAPGRVSKFTSYVLLQWYAEQGKFPVFVHGGVGQYTAAGMFSAGASGVVLDNQLYLTDEAPLSKNFKDIMAKIEEKDSIQVGQTLSHRYRFFTKLATKVTKEIKEVESKFIDDADADEKMYKEISSRIVALNNESATPIQSLFYLGQDAVFAQYFVKKSTKLKDAIEGLFKQVSESVESVDKFDPMKEDSPLAKEHGTKYPIMQGPMANISDNADFAKKINDAGALPFMAMGSLPPKIAEDMLKDADAKIGTWGAGMIGFEAANRMLDEHLDLVKKYNPKFALIAGGTPALTKKVESFGTKTYLHAPAASMMENGINNDCTRFIFEGREAGGHVGSLTSTVLWETSIQKLMEKYSDKIDGLSLVFAGGIGSPTGSCFISGMSSFLAEKGAKVGIQVGTTYLFAEDIVKSGAIKQIYQDLIFEHNETVVTGETLGLSTRTLGTPFTTSTIKNEYVRVKDNMPLKERKHAFEVENFGALLIGAKSFCPSFLETGEVELVQYDAGETKSKGNFMSGDTLIFDNTHLQVEDIHKRFMSKNDRLSANLDALEVFSAADNMINDEVAIIGMGGIYPDANTLDEFWENIISKKYSIKEIADEDFKRFYYNEDRKAEDKSYSKIAGQIDNFTFDHAKYGYSKKDADNLSPSQKTILEAAFQAVGSAGYLTKDKSKRLPVKRTSVIVASCLSNDLCDYLQIKFYYPELKYYLENLEEFKALPDEEKTKITNQLRDVLNDGPKPKHPDGAALNMESARIAAHLGLEGVNYTVDAACATSFTAVDNAIKELLLGDSDVVIAGGLNTNVSPEAFVGFAKMGALSNDGSYPFDQRAGGFVLGTGAGVVVLKRVRDAIRDNDNILAVIKGVGASTDGKGKAIAAPQQAGQKVAIERCYENMRGEGATYGDIDFIEAHGTSTLMGDKTEINTIMDAYSSSETPIGVSSVKSQIGHLLGGAGAAGLIKAVMAINHKTLPPNGKFETLSDRFDNSNSPVYIVKDPAEWKIAEGKTRKAGISSYGFGGINYHVVVEEFNENYKPIKRKVFKDLDYDFNDDRIVITGMGVITPGALNKEEFWNVLLEGKNQTSPIPESRFHNSHYINDDKEFNLPELKAGIIKNFKFNNIKYRIPPASVKSVDRTQLLALDATSQAIEDANLQDILAEKGNKVAVIIGTSSGEMHNENVIRTRLPFIEDAILKTEGVDQAKSKEVAEKLSEALKKRYYKNTEDTVPGLLSNIVPGRIANFFNCNGPSYIVEAECASSAVAFSAAIKELHTKRSDYIICGGMDSNLSPASLKAYQMIKILAPGDNKIFDKDTNGLVMGEGGAIMVMTTYKKAREQKMNIIGEIEKFAFQSYAAKNMLSPTEPGFVEVMDKFYQDSDINKKNVDYIDLFAASHRLVDSWENEAVNKSFNKEVYFGNVKPQISYFRAANPSIVIAKLLLMAKNKQLLPNYSHNPETSIIQQGNVLKPNTEMVNLKEKGAVYLSANFAGLGGNVGHTVVRTLPAWLSEERSAVITTQTSASVAKPVSQPVAASSSSNGEKVVALLSGQGAQYGGMMKELYDSNSTIKSIMDSGEAIFKGERGYSLLDLMFGAGGDKLNSTDNTQPAVFLSTAALYADLKAKGFNPDYYIGHSLGEISALYCADIVSFEDAMKIVVKRSQLMKEAAESTKGQIMVAFKDAATCESLIKKSGLSNVYIANKNSDAQTAISGGATEIDQFCDFLTKEKVMFRKLALSGAFHTPLFKSASEGLGKFIEGINFNSANFSKVYSNVTGDIYPSSEAEVKALLVKQVISPVEFIKCMTGATNSGVKHFIEVGPNKILANLHGKISTTSGKAFPSIDPKKGAVATYGALETYLKDNNLMGSYSVATPVSIGSTAAVASSIKFEGDDSDFQAFLKNNDEQVKKVLHEEFIKHKKERAYEAVEQRGLYTGKVVIPGVSVGLPGTGNKVFSDDNFDRLLAGNSFIESLSKEDQDKLVDKNITKIFKDPQGNAKFVEIDNTEDVIHLAARLGYFNLKDYGVDFEYDTTYGLAIAAGIEALKDAKIPLVLHHKKTSTGKMLPDGFSLPKEMQDNTGIIFTSLFPGFETLMNEMADYYYDKFQRKPYKEFEKLYYFLMEKVKDEDAKSKVTDWYFNIKKNIKDEKYTFNRNLLIQIISLGSAHFAQMIKAKGPNTMVSGACASATQAAGVAEDWIRMGRCERVIIVGGETATSEIQNQWIGAGFLALGAATVKKTVSEAVKPFDEDRNGMIVGSGAVGMIVEREDTVLRRGLRGQAEILGTYLGNSAFHVSRIDVNHLANEMTGFFNRMEKIHGISREEFTRKMAFMSHETYTPAKGGSAEAEVQALKQAFPGNFKNIKITNVKGYTGHTLGAGIEDVVMVKAMQKGIVPAIPNLKKIPSHFADLNFSKGEKGDYQFGFHLAAGFGSHFSFLFVKRIEENSIENNADYANWLKEISGGTNPKLFIKNNTLCVEAEGVEIVQEEQNGSVASTATAAPAASTAAPAKSVDLSEIKKIIAEQTGYEVDMLEDDLDLEADLGIDTVKQVEIFGEIASNYGVEVPEDLQLAELNTIAKLGAFISSKVGGGAGAPVAASAPAAVDLSQIKKIIAEQTGYEVDMLEDDLDLEADLGIDTVKQVEIFGEIASNYGVEVPEDLQLAELNTIAKLGAFISSKVGGSVSAAPAPAQSGASAADVVGKVKGVIAEQTGYEVDMLEDDLDLEADLGIDTVKQVEIFGEISSEFGLEVPEDLQLADLNTIAKLSEYIASKAGGSVAAAPAAAPATSGGNVADVTGKVKSVIAEQTGYEVEMLDENLDLEADLGIDTVKQVEIFGEISSNFGLEVPEDLQLADLNTIAKLSEYIASKAGGSAAPAAAAPAQSGGNSAEVTGKVKGVIAEQTGYEVEMLDENLDLEADLGIDTVKQVEIFGEISSNFGLTVPEDLQLADLNTIAKLSEYIGAQVSGGSAPAKAAAKTAAPVAAASAPATEESDSGIKRFAMHIKKAKKPEAEVNIFKDKTIMVTLDSHGFAEKVIGKIKENSGKVITLGNDDKADVKIDFTKADEESFKKLASENKNVDGLIHLSPLNYYFGRKQVGEEELNLAIKSTFLFVKSFFETLNKKGTVLSALSFDSVLFPYEKVAGKVHPTFGGIAGLFKTINKELEETLVKIVDFSVKKPKESIDSIVDTYISELTCGNKEVEIGYRDGQRYKMSLKIEKSADETPIVKEGGRLLITGGAKGITFEILKRVVETYKTNLVILSRSDITKIDPEFIKPGVGEKEVFAKFKETMQGSKPVEIKKATARVMGLKKTIDNLEALKSLGVEVDYHSVDAADYKSVEAAVSKYESFDGVLHAAGLEESQFIVKKELSSFNRVFDTKITGLLNLFKALKDKEYGFMSTFSSVTAKFGNATQSDYTAANDMLAKMLIKEKIANPGRVYKVYDWTAWEGVGMATDPTVKKVLEARGLKFLPLEEGIQFFMDDLKDSKTIEILISGMDHAFDPDNLLPSGFESLRPDTPFLDTVITKEDSKVVYGRTLDLKRDRFLFDHAIGENPIFLGATGIETMAEAAMTLAGDGMKVFEVSDFSIPYGIKILKGKSKDLMVEATKDGDKFSTKIMSQFINPKGVAMGDPKLHYQGKYSFVKEYAEDKKITLPEFKKIELDGDFQELMYHPKRLFMGNGIFRSVENVLSLDDNKMVTVMRQSVVMDFFTGETDPEFLTNVVLADAMFQTGGMMECLSSNQLVLPYIIESMKFYRPVEKDFEYLCITTRVGETEDTIVYDMQLVDREGNLYIDLKNFSMVKINKLAPEDQIKDKIKQDDQTSAGSK